MKYLGMEIAHKNSVDLVWEERSEQFQGISRQPGGFLEAVKE